MYSDFELLNSVQSCTNPISTRTWESNIISELRMQKRTLDLSLREWVRGEWEVEKKGSVSSRRLKSLGSAQPWTSFLRLVPIWTNLVSEPWTSILEVAQHRGSDWDPSLPLFLPFCSFFYPWYKLLLIRNAALTHPWTYLGHSWHIFATFMWSKWTRES